MHCANKSRRYACEFSNLGEFLYSGFLSIVILYFGSFEVLVDEINKFARDYVDKADDEIEKQLMIGKDLLPIIYWFLICFWAMVMAGICHSFPNVIDNDALLKLATVIYLCGFIYDGCAQRFILLNFDVLC